MGINTIKQQQNYQHFCYFQSFFLDSFYSSIRRHFKRNCKIIPMQDKSQRCVIHGLIEGASLKHKQAWSFFLTNGGKTGKRRQRVNLDNNLLTKSNYLRLQEVNTDKQTGRQLFRAFKYKRQFVKILWDMIVFYRRLSNN